MGDSNGAWGTLESDELKDQFDQYERLPERGSNPALDAFVDRKHVTIESLVKIGARIAPPNVLVFAFPGGIKFRDIVTDARWSYVGSEFSKLKIVHAGRESANTVILAEGESDAARLTMLYPTADVAMLPAGADPRPYAANYAAQLNEYELALLAFDPDAAGDNGLKLLSPLIQIPWKRWVSPGDDGQDWCDWEGEAPALPSPEEVQLPIEQRLLVTARELLSIEPPEIESYYEQALLPVGGQMILHGALKSFKSFLAFDAAAALSQAQPWMGFESIDEPVKVAVMQFEIPWVYYQKRVALLRETAKYPDLFDENFLTWTPLARPRVRAGNKATEDAVLTALDKAGVQVFIFDPIRRGTGAVDLNAEKDVRAVLEFFERIQNMGIAVIATHHDNKAGARAGGGDPLDMTGSGAFGGDADSIVSVALPKGHDLASNERNLHYLLRNAPSPSAKSMKMGERIEYRSWPIGVEEEEDPGPTPGSEAPSI